MALQLFLPESSQQWDSKSCAVQPGYLTPGDRFIALTRGCELSAEAAELDYAPLPPWREAEGLWQLLVTVNFFF